MGGRRGEGREDQVKIIGSVPGGEGDGNSESEPFDEEQAIYGSRKGLEKIVASDNVRKALGPIVAEGAAKDIRERVVETSASRPCKIKSSDAKR